MGDIVKGQTGFTRILRENILRRGRRSFPFGEEKVFSGHGQE